MPFWRTCEVWYDLKGDLLETVDQRFTNECAGKINAGNSKYMGACPTKLILW